MNLKRSYRTQPCSLVVPPLGWYVTLRADGSEFGCPASPPISWHIHVACYGEHLPWRPANEREIAEAQRWIDPKYFPEETPKATLIITPRS